MIETSLKRTWDLLRGKKPHFPDFLSKIRLDGIRGLHDLRISFNYPVSVIAGGNASGKSTVLFSAACAYKVPGAKSNKDFVPSTLFPDYRPKHGERSDTRLEIVIEFNYDTPAGPMAMRWRRKAGLGRKAGWNRSFLGRQGAKQPVRRLFLRTLSNLSNPSEVRSVLSMSRLESAPRENRLNASQLEFAQQMLPFQYTEAVDLSSGRRRLLFAARKDGATYSELHMAAGERSILRLSQDIAQLEGALVLIDEVETGLHPAVQQILMLHLQRLALRNNLQVIVTSHSPVVLDSVPPEGRIFLERDEEAGGVQVREPYRDIVQNALYGRAGKTLNILCEDDAAEGVLRGVLDFLMPRVGIKGETVRIGRDTGAEEFPNHAAAFRTFGVIQDFIFVLDGDKRASTVRETIVERAGRSVPVLFLPGDGSPEIWVWDRLRALPEEDSRSLGVARDELTARMEQQNSIFDMASDTPSEIAKAKLHSLATTLHRDEPGVCRIVAHLESGRKESEIQPLVQDVQTLLEQWRAE